MNVEVVSVERTDLSNCDREQVQFSGAIQPHGCMLVVEEPSLRILHMSENCPEMLGVPADALRGGTLETVLAGGTPAVAGRLANEPLENGPAHLAALSGDDLPSGRALNLFGHRCGGATILEFEIDAGSAERLTLDGYSGVRSTVARLQNAKTKQEFLDLAVSGIRRLIGFDRVMVYKFLDDGSGHVIAEAIADGLPSYLDLHYPASDIPQPARRLFALSGLRHLPDTGYEPIPLVSDSLSAGGEPIDLSYALLRSVSPMYTAYLRNMGVKASLVMPLIRDGVLWGLISCNHESGPRHVPYETRMAAAFLAQMIALMMGSKKDAESLADRLRMKAVLRGMMHSLHGNLDLHACLCGDGPANAAAYIDSGGAALVAEGRITRLGATPSDAAIRDIAACLARGADPVIALDCLSERLPQAAQYAKTAAGVLAVRLSPHRPDYVMWFRPEQEKTVRWAGNPRKPMEIDEHDGSIRITPRTSFAIWPERVRNRSKPWADFEIAAAGELRWALVEVILERAEATERAEQEARASRSTMDAALSAMTDAVCVCGPNRRITHFNEAFATYHKFGSMAECAKALPHFRTLFDVTTPDGAPEPLKQWPVARALRGETGVQVEYELRRTDSNEKWRGSYSFAPIRNEDGGIVGAVIIARDVTVQRQAEAELRDHRQRLKAIFDTSMEGIISIDRHQKIQSANPAALDMFGYGLDEVIGRDIGMLSPQSATPQRGCDTPVIGGRRQSRGLRKNGEIFPKELTVTEASVGGEKLFIGFIRDLSAIEAERRRVQELHDELARVSRMNDMGEVVAALAHEIGQPLTAICNYGAVGRRRLLLSGELTTGIGDIIGKIETQAKRGAEILDRLRGFIEKRDPERNRTCLREVISDAMSLAALSSGARPPSVTLELADSDVAVDVDGVLIKQVLVNFLHNAAEAAACEPQPEITIAASLEKPGFVRVSVSDNGPGVAPEVEDQLFTPFVTTKKQGMGVGLSLCKSIIERHQGETGYHANTPHGAVFFFTLPVSERPRLTHTECARKCGVVTTSRAANRPNSAGRSIAH